MKRVMVCTVATQEWGGGGGGGGGGGRRLSAALASCGGRAGRPVQARLSTPWRGLLQGQAECPAAGDALCALPRKAASGSVAHGGG